MALATSTGSVCLGDSAAIASRAERVLVRVGVVVAWRPFADRLRVTAGESSHSSRPSSRVQAVVRRPGGALAGGCRGGLLSGRSSLSRSTTTRAPRRATLPHDFDPGSSGGRRSSVLGCALRRASSRRESDRSWRAGLRSPRGRGRSELAGRGGRPVRCASPSPRRGAWSRVRGARCVLLAPRVRPDPVRESSRRGASVLLRA